MANLITLVRVVLLFATVALIYLRQPWSAFVAAVLTLIVFVSDALDGYVARKRGRADAAGAVFDIAGDRVVENVYWVVCAHLNLVPVWAPLVMLLRSFAVDAVRSLALADGIPAASRPIWRGQSRRLRLPDPAIRPAPLGQRGCPARRRLGRLLAAHR